MRCPLHYTPAYPRPFIRARHSHTADAYASDAEPDATRQDAGTQYSALSRTASTKNACLRLVPPLPPLMIEPVVKVAVRSREEWFVESRKTPRARSKRGGESCIQRWVGLQGTTNVSIRARQKDTENAGLTSGICAFPAPGTLQLPNDRPESAAGPIRVLREEEQIPHRTLSAKDGSSGSRFIAPGRLGGEPALPPWRQSPRQVRLRLNLHSPYPWHRNLFAGAGLWRLPTPPPEVDVLLPEIEKSSSFKMSHFSADRGPGCADGPLSASPSA
ncbi:hypothetical protein K438DRAFT_1997071 [Mycena galopus ATCC 62051]|nr:hypothetical protein K438DRAFT_1997071 [Mycena galopus ATCC 62051]